jgi:hypothetical protein
MITRTIILFLTIAALGWWCVSCSVKQLAGGTDTETGGTKVTGSIRTPDFKPAANTLVTLFPEGYNPAADAPLQNFLSDTTDADGLYTVRVQAKGKYNLQALGLVTRTRLLVYGLECGDSPVAAPSCTLAAPGAIRAPLPDTVDTVNGYCYIPGTGIFVGLRGKARAVIIDSVPAGVVPALRYGSLISSSSTVIASAIAVFSGDTAMAYRRYSKRIILNTSASGADVRAGVVDFPVLVRLTGENFDFSTAGPDGADLWFAKSDSAPLPSEIERWNAAAGKAEIWVKVDTIRGNDSAQSIIMFWGDSTGPASSPSKGRAVFDTAEGFQGVWHLCDAAGDSVRDATDNRFSGGSPDSARPSAAEGMIGKCRLFDGNNDIITMPGTADGRLSFPQDGNYAVCAWVSIDTFDNAPQCIVSKGYEQYFLRTTYFPSDFPSWEFAEFSRTANWQSSRFPAAAARQWVFLAGVRQGEDQKLYCNGVLADSTRDSWPQGESRNTSNNLSIGAFLKAVTIPANDGYCYFKGSIDEVRIMSRAVAPEWIRLCYVNQRPGDKLVVFK